MGERWALMGSENIYLRASGPIGCRSAANVLANRRRRGNRSAELIDLVVIMMNQSLMSYTRKEVVSWVEAQTKFKFEELKNGVCFCRLLLLRFPEEVARLKFNATPVSEYDCTRNLNMMKKVLNRNGLQLNLNVSEVLASKNNYELAKWFRGLLDREVPAEGGIQVDSTPAASMSRTASCFNQLQTESKKMTSQTPRHRQEPVELFRKHQESADKSKASFSHIKRLSMAKSENHFFKEKKTSCADLKIPRGKGKKEDNAKVILNESMRQLPFEGRDEVGNMLYERALEESIEGFELILERVERAIGQEDVDFDSFKQRIYSCIIGR